MGNYYEGSICIGLKKELSEKMQDLLICLTKDKKNIPDEYFDSEYFKKYRWDYPSFEFGYWIKNQDEDYLFDYEFFDEGELHPQSLVYGKYIRVRFCMKGYNEHAETFIEFIRPYIHELAPNYLGRIEDEDGTYLKDFYIDDSFLNSENIHREIICEECERYEELWECECYCICKKRFLKGMSFKERQKGTLE